LPGSGAAEGLSSLSNDNVSLAINVLPLPKQNGQVIKLKVSFAKSGQYSLRRTALEAIPIIYDIWLIDKYKKDSLDIRANSIYTFDVNLSDTNSYGGNRFILVIRQIPALNVHLLNFTASKTADGTQVEWKTENEQNYTNFTVERSSGDARIFAVVGGVVSNGAGSYYILDSKPLTGANNYRLKMEDLNGTITYSNVIRVFYAGPGNRTDIFNSLSVYPNPTAGPVNLTVNQPGVKSPLVIRIMNNMGALIKESASLQTSWQTDLSSLRPGVYLIQVLTKSGNSLVGKTTVVKL